MNRRDFLRSGAMLAALLGSGTARAASLGRRRTIFVFAPGGWDPTRVLAPAFGTAAATEPHAVAATAGGIDYVDHADRPSVKAFFDLHHARTAVLRGILVPSVAHEACTRIVMTGSTDDGRPDWPAVVANAGADGFLLPGLVVGGPSYAGPLGADVVRTGLYGQLAELVDGSAVRTAGAEGLLPASSDAVDRVLARRAAIRSAAAVAARERTMTGAFATSLDQLAPLRALDGVLDLAGGPMLGQQVDLAVDALSTGTSRVATVAHDVGWDSHVSNDLVQSPAWEDLFGELLTLVERLSTAPSPDGGVLLDDTLVVVLSEMGRTPELNSDLGKDHWPWTSAMLVGAGIRGDTVAGGYEATYEGSKVDPASGRVSASGQDLSTAILGATLLSAMDVDPGDWLPGTPAISSVLA